jgi:hypothetical protein
MMPKVKVLKSGVSQRGQDRVIRPVSVGSVIEVSDAALKMLVKRGQAEEVGEAASAGEDRGGFLGRRKRNQPVPPEPGSEVKEEESNG